jgi:hypothetical protein
MILLSKTRTAGSFHNFPKSTKDNDNKITGELSTCDPVCCLGGPAEFLPLSNLFIFEDRMPEGQKFLYSHNWLNLRWFARVTSEDL